MIVARALAPQGYIAYGILGSGWCCMCTKELAGWGGAAKTQKPSLEPESNRWPFDDPCIHYSRTLCQLSYRRRSVWTPQVAVWHAAVYKPQKRARRQARHEISKSPWPPWKTRSQRHARPAAAALRSHPLALVRRSPSHYLSLTTLHFSPRAQPAKLLLLASLLAKDRIITENGKAFLKGAHVFACDALSRRRNQRARARVPELILRRDPRLLSLLNTFETKVPIRSQLALPTSDPSSETCSSTRLRRTRRIRRFWRQSTD